MFCKVVAPPEQAVHKQTFCTVLFLDVQVQYIEIYNEQVNDLLIHAPGQTMDAPHASMTMGSRLDIREHATGEVRT